MKTLLLTVVFFTLFVVTANAQALPGPGNPFAPPPLISAPTTPGAGGGGGAGGSNQVNLISPVGQGNVVSDANSYLDNLYIVLIVVAIILAVIRLMICGIQYASSESVSSKSAARTCMGYALGGLLLVLIGWLILNTINPALVSGRLGATGQTSSGSAQGTSAGTPTGNTGGASTGQAGFQAQPTGGGSLGTVQGGGVNTGGALGGGVNTGGASGGGVVTLPGVPSSGSGGGASGGGNPGGGSGGTGGQVGSGSGITHAQAMQQLAAAGITINNAPIVGPHRTTNPQPLDLTGISQPLLDALIQLPTNCNCTVQLHGRVDQGSRTSFGGLSTNGNSVSIRPNPQLIAYMQSFSQTGSSSSLGFTSYRGWNSCVGFTYYDQSDKFQARGPSISLGVATGGGCPSGSGGGSSGGSPGGGFGSGPGGVPNTPAP